MITFCVLTTFPSSDFISKEEERRGEERKRRRGGARRPLAAAVALAMADDDDDDFQEPVGSISLAKRLVPSSLEGASRGRRESSGSLPLGPSNGASRPRKRVKVSPSPAAVGKENREVRRNIQRQLSAAKGDKAEVNPTPHRAVETLGNVSVDSSAFHQIAEVGEANRINGTAPEKSTTLGERRGNGGDSREPKTSNLILTEEPVEEASEARSTQARKTDGRWERETSSEQKENCFCMPIEVSLLGPCLGGSDGMVDDRQGEDLGEDIEAGTQLKELMNLCSELDEGGLDCGIPLEDGNASGNLVECPICGTNITGLGEELRVAHTNLCLDIEEQAKVDCVSVISSPALFLPVCVNEACYIGCSNGKS